MSKRKKKKRPTALTVPSPTLLAARLRSGSGKHNSKPTRAVERRTAIQENS